MTPYAQRLHKDLKRKLAAELESGTQVLAMNAASAYSKLRQVANGRLYADLPEGVKPSAERPVEKIHDEKSNMLVELVESLCGEQLLVFYQFSHDLAAIQSKIKNCGVVRGGQSPKDTQDSIDRWLRGKTQVLVAQSNAACEGLNLQEGGCRHCAWYGLPDIAANFTQGNARIYRQGATSKTVTIHRLMSQDSVEEVQCDRLDGKIKDQSEFLQMLKEWADG